MTKYYEKTKSSYARDIDHLVTFNKKWFMDKKKTLRWSKNYYSKQTRGYKFN